MKNKKGHNWLLSLKSLLIIAFLPLVTAASRPGWERKEVNWRMTGGSRIKSINYSEENCPPLYSEKGGRQAIAEQEKAGGKRLPFKYKSSTALSTPNALVNVIDSPPIDGFVPWIAVTVTDDRSDDLDWVAEPHMSVMGRYLTNNPETDFTIGIFDTGATAHVISSAAANRTGIYAADLLTPNMVEIKGATHSVFGWVSQPLGIFIDGLGAINPNEAILDSSMMVGQSNVSVVVGDIPSLDEPDLPTAIGSPMSVNFVSVIYNDRPVTITYDGNEYVSPDIRFYDQYDSRIPEYANYIPLNLIPSGAVNIQYIPDLEAIMEFIFQPGQPSIIVGNLAQSLFFVDSVDLHKGTRSAIDKRRFMLDTGAQITVIGSSVGSRLGLNPAKPDFEVEIQDVTGEMTIEPGFYVDSLEIPALGDWLSFTNVPVILHDIASPEGVSLEGIIGMNLFVEYNLVLRGGGMLRQDPPFLEFEHIQSHLIADVAPPGGDGIVNFLDFAALADAWLATPASPNWNSDADLAPIRPDGLVNQLDFKLFAQYWGQVQAQ